MTLPASCNAHNVTRYNEPTPSARLKRRRHLGLEQFDNVLVGEDDGGLADVDDHAHRRQRRLQILRVRRSDRHRHGAHVQAAVEGAHQVQSCRSMKKTSHIKTGPRQTHRAWPVDSSAADWLSRDNDVTVNQ